MSFWSRSVHMLWALLKSSVGRANFFVTFQVAATTAVAVPGLVLWAVFSYSVSTQTSPTPLAAGAVAFGSVTGSWKWFPRKVSRFGMTTGLRPCRRRAPGLPGDRAHRDESLHPLPAPLRPLAARHRGR